MAHGIPLETIQAIVDRAKAGEHPTAIAATVGACIATVYSVMKANGLHQTKRQQDAERRREIAKALLAGKDKIEVALEFGVTPQVVHSVALEYRCDPESAKEGKSVYSIIASILLGHSWDEIATMHGVSKQRVGQVAQKLREHGVDPEMFSLARFLKEAGFVHNNHRGPQMMNGYEKHGERMSELVDPRLVAEKNGDLIEPVAS